MKRRISATTLPISPSNSSPSSSSSADVITPDSSSTTRLTTVPGQKCSGNPQPQQSSRASERKRIFLCGCEEAESKSTYEYLGFNSDTAQAIWTRYSTRDPDMPYGFLDFAEGQLGYILSGPSSDSQECNEFMTRVGVKPWLRQAILMDEFADLRNTATCVFWIMDTMEMRYRNLLSMIYKNQMMVEKRGHKPGQIGSLSKTPLTDDPTCRKRGSSLSAPSQTVLQQTYSDNPQQFSRDSERTMLFWAKDIEQCESVYNEQTGEIDLDPSCYCSGGFSGGRKVLSYWTSQRELADRYAQWAKYRSPDSGIGIIQIAPPNSWIKQLSPLYLWYDGCSI
ncbi:hypothetical protein EV356DRAFT_504930 [Viridothelium virens]|uniref:Uncharacterized protein n=1 Tax=Viridothelium virens TaxID=1048519 RepID=A0A6A6H4M6_VIRVR|nr:hypothetical protein EV356DRAFT_504930 [Viridothelium virens]